MVSTSLVISLLVMGLTLVYADSPEVDVSLDASDNVNEAETADGQPAKLKILEPIDGTNLFYNLPYRWLDDTSPGCYVTWFWEVFQDTNDNKNREVLLVCNEDDQKWFNHVDSQWVIEKPKPGAQKTSGILVIKNIGAGNILERVDSAGTQWVAVDGRSLPWIHTWNIQADPYNRNRVRIEDSGKILSQFPRPNHRAFLYVKHDNEAGYPYIFEPYIALELKIVNFQFARPAAAELARHTSPKSMIDEYTITNNSTATVTRRVEVTETVRNEFGYGFSEKVKNAFKVKGKIEVPFLADFEIENTFEMEFGSTQNWKNSTDKTFKLAYDVTVPAKGAVRISAWYDKITEMRMDFTAKVEITGKTTRITMFDDIIKDAPASGDMIRKQLENSDFQGTLLQTKSDRVVVEMKGAMSATVGVRGRLNVNDDIVYRAEPN